MNFNREKFKELRLRRSLTQKEVAKACGVSDAMVAKWEKGSIPDPNKIKYITKVLSCRVSELFDISDFEEIDIERERIKQEHHGADVYDDIVLMESLQLELSLLKKSDPDYHDKLMGFEHQIELCKAEIEHKEKAAMNDKNIPSAVSIHGNMNAVGSSSVVFPDVNPYTDKLSSVELFRNSLIVHLMGLKDVPSDTLFKILVEIKNFQSNKGE